MAAWRGSRWTWLVAAAAVAGLAAAGVAAVVAGGGGADDGATLLPDLVQRSPYQLVGQTAQTARGARFRIGFSSAVENHGRGPLVVVGRRIAGKRERLRAMQVIRRVGAEPVTRPNVGLLRYTRSTGHQHWHLLAFERYTLRRPGGRVLRGDRKTGFCLGDRYDALPATRLAGEPTEGEWQDECGRDLPGLTAIEEGISVGYGDDYFPLLEGQFVDVTGLPAGRYELVHWANPERRLRESSYANNAASVLLDLGWPAGMKAPPSISVVRRCGDGKRCVGAR